jgi:CBS domain containing-hemolysin-like protein
MTALPILPTIVLMATCFLLEGFFSGSEIALVSADRLKLQSDAQEGQRGSVLALRMLEQPAWTLGTCLVGTNMCTITAATLAASMVTQQFQLPAAAAVLIVFPFTLTVGEMLPKAIFQHHADRIVPYVVFPLRAVGLLFAPALFVLAALNHFLDSEEQQSGVTREELRLLLDGARRGDLTANDRQLIKRVLEFTESTVEDAMVPLIHVVAIPATATIGQAARRMAESGHSRLPIYRDRIDQITGIVLHQDLFEADDWSGSVGSIARSPLFVPEIKRVDALLAEMRNERKRMAIVVDEYGGAAGIITVEDLLEEIVGEIEDESDRARPMVRRVTDREWLASGRAEREHLEQAAGMRLPEGDFETLAGFILFTLGSVPHPGAEVNHGRYSIQVTKASDRAVLEVRIRRTW